MNTKKTSTYNFMSKLGFISYGKNDEKILNLYEDTDLMIIYSNIVEQEGFDQIRLVKKDCICPHCNCELVNNGTTRFNFNKNYEIRIQQYKCTNKNETHYIYSSKEKYVDMHCNYTHEIRSLSSKIGLLGNLSYASKSELLEALTGIKINRETIFYFGTETTDDIINQIREKQLEEIKQLNIKPSGHYGYDEQYVFVNGDLFLRMTIMDNKTNLIINEDIISYEQFDKHTIKRFLEKSLDGKPIKSITTDGHNAYPSIIKSLGAIHHRCIFHVMKNLMDSINRDIRTLENKIITNTEKIEKNKEEIARLKEEVSGKTGKPSHDDKEWNNNIQKRKKLQKENTKLIQERKNCRKKLKDLLKYKDKISLIFKSKKESTAMKRYNELKDNIDNLPEKIANFIKRIENDIPSMLNHITNEDIPKTNNKVEGYYRTTLPKSQKRIYRTLQGLKRQITLSQIRWTHRQVLQKQNPLTKIKLLFI